MAIDEQHKQYKKYFPIWKEITDIINQENLKDLLIPVESIYGSTKKTNVKSRNDAYQERAVFYAITANTVKGQIGLMFSKEPKLELPSQLEYVKTNIDGRGNSIFQQSKAVAKNVDAISREGLYTSYPITNGEVSQADINSGAAVATIQRITAQRIINWREQSFGAKIKLVFLTFTEIKEEMQEDYTIKETQQIRELFLDTTGENHIYKERVWSKTDNENWVKGEDITPRDKNGKLFDEIQFDFIGAENNDSDVDEPNQLAIARLNKAHFRNSAEYEDNVWWIGQSQPWMSGITQNHINLMKENNMYVGSRELMGVPPGEQFGIDGAPENPLVRQAMLDKVDMMVSLGAQQIQVGGVAKTATQTNYEKGTQYSVTSMVANNVSSAYTSALARMERFMLGEVTGESLYQIDTDFIKPDVDPALLKEIASQWQVGARPTFDYIRRMKELGEFDKDKSDKDYLDELFREDMPNLENTNGEE